MAKFEVARDPRADLDVVLGRRELHRLANQGLRPRRVVLKPQGRVEEVSLNPGERFVAHGKSVIARARGGLPGGATHQIAAQDLHVRKSYCRTYDGPGRLLLTRVPYGQFRLLRPQESPRSTASA